MVVDLFGGAKEKRTAFYVVSPLKGRGRVPAKHRQTGRGDMDGDSIFVIVIIIPRAPFKTYSHSLAPSFHTSLYNHAHQGVLYYILILILHAAVLMMSRRVGGGRVNECRRASQQLPRTKIDFAALSTYAMKLQSCCRQREGFREIRCRSPVKLPIPFSG